MTSNALSKQIPAITPYLLTLRDQLASTRSKAPASFVVGELKAELRLLGTALWLIVRRERKGGIALRAVHWTGDSKVEFRDPAPPSRALGHQPRRDRVSIARTLP
jgi:hypothetical protein